MHHPRRATPAAALLLLGATLSLAACSGRITELGLDGGYAAHLDRPPPSRDDAGADTTTPPPPPTDAAAPASDTQAWVLPGPGEPCPEAQCTDDALCLGGMCHRKCVQSSSCNEKNSGGSCAADEICLGASSFADACYFAAATVGEPCGDEAGDTMCRPGALCVKVDSRPARCLKLCQYGCAAGDQCLPTNNKCDVCVPL